jgi:hypothetical protein
VSVRPFCSTALHCIALHPFGFCSCPPTSFSSFFSAHSRRTSPLTQSLTHVCLSPSPGFSFSLRPSPANFNPPPFVQARSRSRQANRQADATRAKFFPIPIILSTPLQNPRLHASSSPKSSPTQLHYRHPQRSWVPGFASYTRSAI